MTQEQTALLAIIRTAVSGTKVDLPLYDDMQLMDLCHKQRVVDIAYAGVELLRNKYGEKVLDTDALIKLYGTVMKKAPIMAYKRKLSYKFIANSESTCVVLKGLDYSRFWPVADWRGYGDLDVITCRFNDESKIWTLGDNGYKELNAKARQMHCLVIDHKHYKHSVIRYKKLTIENHLHLTMHDDTQSGKFIEAELRDILVKAIDMPSLPGIPERCQGKMLSPPVDFTALYIIVHAHQHFFWEGFTIKIILDWLFFLSSEEANNVNWQKVISILDKAEIRGFADVMTTFCERYLDLQLNIVQNGSKISPFRTVEDNILDAFTEAVFEKPIKEKTLQLIHRFKRMWRFRQFLGANIIIRIKNTLIYNYLHKKPKYHKKTNEL